MIGIEPEIIQCAEANRVGVAILLNGFGIPRYGITGLSYSPRRAAVTLVVASAILGPAGMLRRRMKPDVRDVYSGSNGNAERFDRAIEVLVIKRILIVPDARSWITDLVTHKPDAIVTWVRLNSIHCRPSPRHDGRFGAHGGAYTSKTKWLVDSGHAVLTIRSVVIHVTLARMILAPGVLVRDDVLRLSKICGSRIQ